MNADFRGGYGGGYGGLGKGGYKSFFKSNLNAYTITMVSYSHSRHDTFHVAFDSSPIPRTLKSQRSHPERESLCIRRHWSIAKTKGAVRGSNPLMGSA